MTGEVFVSHSSRDQHLTTALVEALRQHGFASLWINFDPVDGIPPGRDWEQEIYRGLRRCDAVIVVNTPAWHGSQWCFSEVVLARSLGKTVIAVQPASGDAVPPPVPAAQAFTFADVSQEALDPVFRELAVLGAGALHSFRWDPSRPPYPGLSPLQAEDAGVFFGRRDETRTLLDLFVRLARYGDKCGVVLVGASGCGKSSLLRAGVLPQLARRAEWRVVGPLLPDGGMLRRAREELTAPGDNVLVAVDQIDDALAAGGDEVETLLDLLDEVAGLRGRALLVGTLRADALAAFDEHLAGRSELIQRVVVGPPVWADYREIIEGPAAAAGVDVDPALVDVLLADLAASDALPLLAVTLRRLWDSGMTLDAYRQTKGLSGAIAESADLVVAASGLDAERLDDLRRAFLGMVRIDRDGRLSRRPLRLDDVSAATRDVLDRFVAERLLVTGATPGSIELAHDALLRAWPTLARWVDEAREDLIRLERFESALARWRDQPSATLDALALAEADALAAHGFSALQDADAQDLLSESRRRLDEAAAREREREQALRVSQSLRLASEAREASRDEPATGLLVAWEALLWDRNELSETVFRETLARMPAPVVPLCAPTDRGEWPSTGFAAGGDAVFVALADQNRIDIRELDGTLRARADLAGDGPVTAVAVPAGILSCRDGCVRLHDLSGRLVDELTLEYERVHRFREDLRLIASETAACLLRVGDRYWLLAVDNRVRLVRELDIGERERGLVRVIDVHLDRSGDAILTECSDDVWRLWDASGRLRRELPSPGATPMNAAFLADAIVTGSGRGAGQLWTLDGQSIGMFREPAGRDLFMRAVHPNRTIFATALTDPPTLEVRDSSGRLLQTLDGGDEATWAAAFSHDGRLLASGSADRVVRVWDWQEDRLLSELHGHGGTVNWVGFHPADADLLLSRSHDREVRLWRLRAPPLPNLGGHREAVHTISSTAAGLWTSDKTTTRWWSPRSDGLALPGSLVASRRSTAVTVDADQIVRLWDAEDGTPRQCCEVRSRSRDVKAALSDDGRRFVVSGDEFASLWSGNGTLLGDLVGPDAPELEGTRGTIVGVSFGPDGRTATAAKHGMVWIWAADGSLLTSFVPDNVGPDPLLAFAADPRQELLLIGLRHRAEVWSWHGERLNDLTVAGYKVLAVAFSPDGSRIVTIADNPDGRPSYVVELWDRGGRRQAALDAPHVFPFVPLRFDPESRYAIVPGADVRIFDRDGGRVGRLAGSQGTWPTDVAVAPDGEHVAVAFSDGSARVWSLRERRRVMTLGIQDATCIAFDADGRRLLAGRASGVIEQHAIHVEDLFEAARARLARGFAPDELDRFGIPQPPRLQALLET